MTFGKFRGAIITELSFYNITIAVNVINSSERSGNGKFVNVIQAAVHSAQLVLIHTGKEIFHSKSKVALCIEVVAAAVLCFSTDECTYLMIASKRAVKVQYKLPQH